ncbi:MAG: hypothetical protein HY290_24970 [Planctomycetia bacterium]|nr:hypothetical protein [Planctomycetia bacterium]
MRSRPCGKVLCLVCLLSLPVTLASCASLNQGPDYMRNNNDALFSVPDPLPRETAAGSAAPRRFEHGNVVVMEEGGLPDQARQAR